MEKRHAQTGDIYIENLYVTYNELDVFFKKHLIEDDYLKSDLVMIIDEFIHELSHRSQSHLLSDAIKYAEKINEHISIVNSLISKIDRMCYLEYANSDEYDFELLLDKSVVYRNLEEIKELYYRQSKYYSDIVRSKEDDDAYNNYREEVRRSLFYMSDIKSKKNLEEISFFSIGDDVSSHDKYQIIDKNLFFFEYFNSGGRLREAIEGFIEKNKEISEKKGRENESYTNEFLNRLLLIFRLIPKNEQICIKDNMPKDFFIFCDDIISKVYLKLKAHYGKNFRPPLQSNNERAIRARLYRFNKKNKSP